jgi:hypothetical protein
LFGLLDPLWGWRGIGHPRCGHCFDVKAWSSHRSWLNQYRELKSAAADRLLLMQVGAFMQVMNEGHPNGSWRLKDSEGHPPKRANNFLLRTIRRPTWNPFDHELDYFFSFI